MATTKRTAHYRSSVSGKYVQKDSARRRPKITVKETDKVKTDTAKTEKVKTRKPKARKTKRPRTTATTARVTARRGRSTRR